MKTLLALGVFILSLPVFGAEFQKIDPALDAEFISKLGMFEMGSPLPERFNILIVGQDNSTSKKKVNGRSRLGSRADIIMVLSVGLSRGDATILSIYRDNEAYSQGCISKLGKYPAYEKINGVYSIAGRRQFIPCLEGLLEERLTRNSEFSDLLDANGEFHIHAFYEGTRTYTIRPVAKDSLAVVMDNKYAFTTTYGFSAIGAAMSVLWSGGDIQKALSSETPVEIDDSDVDADYLTIELKERMAYKAGGYQRAFNFATVIGNILGWAAYGIEQYKNENYEFLGHFFGDVVTKNFSSSHDFKALEKDVFMRDGKHVLKELCFKNDVSPVRIVQWGHSATAYAVYENGRITTKGSAGLLRHLKLVPILPNPPSCD